MTAHDWLTGHARWLCLALADHIWQSTLIAGVALLFALVALRRARARLRYAALFFGILKFAVPIALFSYVPKLTQLFDSVAARFGVHNEQSYFLLTRGVEPATYVSRVAQWQQIHLPAFIFELTTIVWLIVAALLLILWAYQNVVFSARLRAEKTSAAAHPNVLRVVESVRARINLRTKVGLVVSPLIDIPGVRGIFRPMILLPPELERRLDEREFESVILHELIHVKSRDNLAGFVQTIICQIFWFHPLVWYLNRKLMSMRELHCDEEVIARTGAAHTYASGLLKVLESCVGQPVAPGVSGAARVSDIRLRFDKILSSDAVPIAKKQYRWAMIAFYGSLTLVIFLASFLAGNRYTRSAIYSNAHIQFSGSIFQYETKSGNRLFFPHLLGPAVEPIQMRAAYEKWKDKELANASGQVPPHFYLAVTTEKVAAQMALVQVGVVPESTPYSIQVSPCIYVNNDESRPRPMIVEGLGENSSDEVASDFSERIFEAAIDERVNCIEVAITSRQMAPARKLAVNLSETVTYGTMSFPLN